MSRKVLLQAKSVEAHLAHHPEKTRPYMRCKKCSKLLPNEYYLLKHCRRHHGPVEECKVCGVVVGGAMGLEVHKRRHSPKDIPPRWNKNYPHLSLQEYLAPNPKFRVRMQIHDLYMKRCQALKKAAEGSTHPKRFQILKQATQNVKETFSISFHEPPPLITKKKAAAPVVASITPQPRPREEDEVQFLYVIRNPKYTDLMPPYWRIPGTPRPPLPGPSAVKVGPAVLAPTRLNKPSTSTSVQGASTSHGLKCPPPPAYPWLTTGSTGDAAVPSTSAATYGRG